MNITINASTFLLLVSTGSIVCGTLLGYNEALSKKWKSRVNHFTAGLVLAALGTELIPQVAEEIPKKYKKDSIYSGMVTGFTLGAAAMVTLRTNLVNSFFAKKNTGGKSVTGYLAAVCADLLIDGLLVGAIVSDSEQAGLMVGVGLAIESLFLSWSTSNALMAANWDKTDVIKTGCLLAASFIGGFMIGKSYMPFIMKKYPAIYAGVMAFGVAAFSWLIVEELIPEAHQESRLDLISPCFFFSGLLGSIIIGWIFS